MRSIEPRYDDSPRLCSTCDTQEVAFAHGELCVEHWVEYLISNDDYAQAFSVAADEGLTVDFVLVLLEREREQRVRSARAASIAAMNRQSVVQWVDLGNYGSLEVEVT